VATYNIRRCRGPDGRRNPDRVARVVASLGADIVALQEVDSRVRRTGFLDQLEYLAAATSMHPVPGPVLERDYGGYGNGFLTRLPVLATRHHGLGAVGRSEPRAALEIVVATRLGPLTAITSHLGLWPRERRLHLRGLRRALEGVEAGPVVLLGDFNLGLPGAGTLLWLDRLLGRSPSPPSFPSRLPLLRLDRIWMRPRSALAEVETVQEPPARAASDHLPLRARLDLGPDGAGPGKTAGATRSPSRLRR
jgi:endonuclease/exonuclease/phosphatase family metal-dependent hydrolase